MKKSFLDIPKPNTLVIPDIRWKYLVRSVLKGKNTFIIGPTGCGKTLAAKSVAQAFSDREFYYFNMGSTQDPRSALIGNTHFDKSTGTFFNESSFVSAIRKEGSIILLDELSRSHPDAWNILMSVLDDEQRYLRLDEKVDREIVKVANNVSFIATANMGVEYTSTKIIDRALLNRFSVKLEMDFMNPEDEATYLKNRFDIKSEKKLELLKSIIDIASHTRKAAFGNSSGTTEDYSGNLSNFISTRDMVEIAELINDEFTLLEIAETVIYPNFDKEGGVDSERTYIKQLVQKYVTSVPDGSLQNLFSGGINSQSPNNPPF